jgi:hypothetical protein
MAVAVFMLARALPSIGFRPPVCGVSQVWSHGPGNRKTKAADLDKGRLSET